MGTSEEQLMEEVRKLREEKRTLLKVLTHLAETIERLVDLKVDGEPWQEMVRRCQG